MVMGLGPGVSLLTRLWEATQARVQVISTDQVASFLRQTTPSGALLTQAGGRL